MAILTSGSVSDVGRAYEYHTNSSNRDEDRRDHFEGVQYLNHDNASSDHHDKVTDLYADDTPWTASRSSRAALHNHLFKHETDSKLAQRVSVLERRLATSDSSGLAGPRQQQSLRDSALEDVLPERNNHLAGGLKQPSCIAKLQERTLDEFTNRYTDDTEDYAIELLLIPSSLQSLAPGQEVPASTAFYSRDTGHHLSHGSQRETSQIRINSPIILAFLEQLSLNVDPAVSVVMHRPWKTLAHHEQQIRVSFQKLCLEYGMQTLGSANDATVEGGAGGDVLSAAHPEESDHHQQEISHLRCLISFLDQYVKPLRTRFGSNEARKVKFIDLWWLFQPGDDVYLPLKVRDRKLTPDEIFSSPEVFQGRYERMWRVITTAGGRWSLTGDQTAGLKLETTPFRLSCYHLDFDGKFFLPVVHPFEIVPFAGERAITSLDVMPTRYLKDQMQIENDFNRHGASVFEQLSRRSTHFYYAGPTLPVHPCGCTLKGETVHQEFIESEVIVDFRTTLLRHPSWRPRFTSWKVPSAGGKLISSTITYWTDRSKRERRGVVLEEVLDDRAVDKQRDVDFRAKELIFAPTPSDWLSNQSRVPDKDTILLAARCFAFILRTRTFAPIWVPRLKDIRPQTSSLRNLQLRDDSIKKDLQALVRTHFRQEKLDSALGFDSNLVRGKGKGLIILLHGAPGVGKTSTAESMAAANGRPLLQITCGDLGMTPREVEQALKDIFRYAQMWQCVLLLDECDVFLAARDKHDIQRNSLVSVFLRVLEFYSGVLFLTTNRVGVLDDAVRSRITWAIHYPRLSEEQYRKIWKSNLKLLQEHNKHVKVDRRGILNFASRTFYKSSETNPRWNGRQISTAFKAALSLAEWDALGDTARYGLEATTTKDEASKEVQVTSDHFERFAAANEKFVKYTNEVHGNSEEHRAWINHERADDGHSEAEQDHASDNLLSPNQPMSHRRPSSSGTPRAPGLSIDDTSIRFTTSPTEARPSSTATASISVRANRRSSIMSMNRQPVEGAKLNPGPSLKRRRKDKDRADPPSRPSATNGMGSISNKRRKRSTPSESPSSESETYLTEDERSLDGRDVQAPQSWADVDDDDDGADDHGTRLL